ncbi:MAG TPA: BPSS1780 family membrane protein [Ideonella sp.]|nr:BPSS1780 family membrane protein [Ideonella sp.]
MGLKLQVVAPAQGLRWVGLGFREFLRRPLPYTGLFVAFMFGALLMTLLPWIGGLLLLMAVPLLSLAFMMAAHGAQRGEPAHPGVYVTPWRKTQSPAQRRSLLVLCFAYAAASSAVFALGRWVDGGATDAMLIAASTGSATAEELAKLASAPGVFEGALVRTLLTALLSIPFWHAPALVFWGGQGPAQAMFSSALALWRAKGAFLLYSLGWTAALMLSSVIVILLTGVLGAGPLAGFLLMPIALMFTTAFYVSLYFSFTDCFGVPD